MYGIFYTIKKKSLNCASWSKFDPDNGGSIKDIHGDRRPDLFFFFFLKIEEKIVHHSVSSAPTCSDSDINTNDLAVPLQFYTDACFT